MCQLGVRGWLHQELRRGRLKDLEGGDKTKRGTTSAY